MIRPQKKYEWTREELEQMPLEKILPLDTKAKLLDWKRSFYTPGGIAEKIVYVLVWLGVVLIVVFALTTTVLGADPPPDLWKGIIGEAVSEGYDGMYAVCCVYKNRLDAGLPLGCVALKRKDIDVFVERQGQKYIDMAKKIVDVVFSGGIDVTNGATHYENIDVFGVPYWAKDMIITATIGSHTFYAKGSAFLH